MDKFGRAPSGSALPLWRVWLVDGPVLETTSGDSVRRFRSKRVGALLAYLALRLDHPCPREELYAALWPEEDDMPVVANRLRVCLASLRRQLEPPGVSFGAVLDVGDAGRVRLRADSVWCDIAALDVAWKAGRFAEAARLARGSLLPGYYDDWALSEQSRYESLREELANVAPPECAADEAVPASAPRVSTHRLPLYLTRFFGREQEERELRDRLGADRLVTLTGPGGIGKTRLAVETARKQDRPCVFVPLADLTDPRRVAEAALKALDVLPQADVEPIRLLAAVLNGRAPHVLILDNAEHLLDSVAELSLQLLEAVPDLQLLVTSRQRLDIAGEAVIPLLTLVPPPDASELDQLMACPAPALFVDRARNARPDFALAPRQAAALNTICRQLEGIPLALELAAARVIAQTPAQIAETLATGLLNLKSRQRGLSPRHRSLRAAIDGSFDLLPADLRGFFARLSVFRGGWTEVAARAVTGCAETTTFLEDLAVRSLVVVSEEATDGALRWSFLETLRQYAAEQLSETEREPCANRHADYYLGLAADVSEADMRTMPPLDPELENLLIGLEWRRNSPDASFWNGLAGALVHAFVRGHHRVAVRWIEDFAGRVSALPDYATRFRLRYAMCLILPDSGRLDEAERCADEMEADAVTNGDPIGAVYADCIRGYVLESRGFLEAAVQVQRETLSRARALSDASLMQMCLSHTSGTLHDYGALVEKGTEARNRLLREAESQARELRSLVPPYSRRVPLASILVAAALFFQDRLEEAHGFLKEAQRHAIELGTTPELMYSFVYESAIALECGRAEEATLLYGAFLALRERMGYSLARVESFRPAWIRLSSDLLANLGPETFDALLTRGKRTPPDRLLAELPALCSFPRRV